MMHELQSKLLELQQLDQEIEAAKARLRAFDPQLATLDEPVVKLQREVDDMTTRLATLRKDETRLERNADDKRARLGTYEERLQRVRNKREEEALRMEMDLIQRAVDADEQEALEMLDQATRTDLKLDDMIKRLDKQRSELEPSRAGLQAERQEAADAVEVLKDRRETLAGRVDKPALRLYERLRSGRTSMVLAPLTSEGACGHCFNILPVQEQSVIRGGGALHRCEACGVILYAAD